MAPAAPLRRLSLRPRPRVLEGLEGMLARTAQRLDAVDPRPLPRSDDDLRPVMRLLTVAGGAGGSAAGERT